MPWKTVVFSAGLPRSGALNAAVCLALFSLAMAGCSFHISTGTGSTARARAPGAPEQQQTRAERPRPGLQVAHDSRQPRERAPTERPRPELRPQAQARSSSESLPGTRPSLRRTSAATPTRGRNTPTVATASHTGEEAVEPGQTDRVQTTAAARGRESNGLLASASRREQPVRAADRFAPDSAELRQQGLPTDAKPAQRASER